MSKKTWPLVAAKRLCRFEPGTHLAPEELSFDPIGPQYIRTHEIGGFQRNKDSLYVPSVPAGAAMVLPEDGIICFDGFINSSGSGTIGQVVWGLDGMVGPSLHKIIAHSGVDPRYPKYALASHISYNFIVSNARGAIAQHAGHIANDIPIPLPPLSEQQAICDFLDQSSGKIDLLIAEQAQLIALLQEKRQAVISHAVTKGLDASAPMKDSGISWLGQMPTGWEVLSLKTVASCNDDVLPEDTTPDQIIEYVEISDVEADRGITRRTAMAFGDAPSRARRRVRPGDVLVSTVRTYLRAIATVPEDCDALVVSTGFAVFRPRRIHPWFLNYVFHSEYLISEIIARSVGVSYPAINASEIARLPIPLPPPAEQRAIAAFLDRECGKIDTLITEAERAIALLKERRLALISAAVTGKIDVRNPPR